MRRITLIFCAVLLFWVVLSASDPLFGAELLTLAHQMKGPT